MEAVCDLLGVRGGGADSLGIRAGPVTAHDLRAGVVLEPCGGGFRGPVGQHVDRPAGLDVDQSRIY